jgi:hypothetical protein
MMTAYSIQHPKDMTQAVLEQRVASHGGMVVIEYFGDRFRRMNVETTEENMKSFKEKYQDLSVVERTTYSLPRSVDVPPRGWKP